MPHNINITMVKGFVRKNDKIEWSIFDLNWIECISTTNNEKRQKTVEQ